MIFVDAGPMIGFFYEDDPFHKAAEEGFQKLERSGEPVFTTAHCVWEAIAVLSMLPPPNLLRAAHAGLEILQWQMEIVRASTVDERRALRLLESYADHKASFVDCLSFLLMDARGTRTAFTFDEDHFVDLRELTPWVPIPKLETKEKLTKEGKKRRRP